MFVLQKLILAHLIADFMLQFEELYRLKLRSTIGHVLHASCHAIVSLLLVWPYLTRPGVWGFVALVTVVHFFQDLWKYGRMGRKNTFFVLFVWDQLVHLVCLLPVLALPFSREILGFPDAPNLDAVYRDPQLTLLAVACVTTGFALPYLLHAFRTAYLPNDRPDHFITSLEMAHGLLERTVVAGLFLLAPPWAWLFAPAVGALRTPFPRLHNRADFLLSLAASALTGLLFRLWLRSGY